MGAKIHYSDITTDEGVAVNLVCGGVGFTNRRRWVRYLGEKMQKVRSMCIEFAKKWKIVMRPFRDIKPQKKSEMKAKHNR